jgi:hypothetical protein
VRQKHGMDIRQAWSFNAYLDGLERALAGWRAAE